jgi:hypothetical protein
MIFSDQSQDARFCKNVDVERRLVDAKREWSAANGGQSKHELDAWPLVD